MFCQCRPHLTCRMLAGLQQRLQLLLLLLQIAGMLRRLGAACQRGIRCCSCPACRA